MDKNDVYTVRNGAISYNTYNFVYEAYKLIGKYTVLQCRPTLQFATVTVSACGFMSMYDAVICLESSRTHNRV